MAEAFENLNTPSPATPGSSGASNATAPIDPRKWLSPGWYWADLREQDLPAWNQFKAGNSSVRQTKSTAKGNFTWVLFQVAGSYPVIYTPPGLAYPAFKGEKTEVQDVFEGDADYQERAGLGGSASEDFMAFWKNFMGQLGTAGQVVLWGGVAIVLWQVFQKTGGSTPRIGRREVEEVDEEITTTRRSSRPRSVVDRRHSEPARTRSGTLVSHYR